MGNYSLPQLIMPQIPRSQREQLLALLVLPFKKKDIFCSLSTELSTQKMLSANICQKGRQFCKISSEFFCTLPLQPEVEMFRARSSDITAKGLCPLRPTLCPAMKTLYSIAQIRTVYNSTNNEIVTQKKTDDRAK